MNTTTKQHQERRKEIIRLGIYFAIWILFTVTLYHLVTQ
jgi:hypothetical protein